LEIKDLCFCLTLPFWKKMISNTVYVISIRNNFNVAKPLEKRDNHSISNRLSLWEEYLFNIIKNIEGGKRIFTM